MSESSSLFVERLRKAGLATAVRSGLRNTATGLHRAMLIKFWGMEIGRDCQVSLSAILDKTNPRGIHIGDSTAINFRSCVLAHDYSRGLHADTRIGKQCQIGAYAIIMPGVTIGDNCVVAPASVVMRDVPPNSLVAGNPARVMEKDIKTGRWGKILRDRPLPTKPLPSSPGPVAERASVPA
jgi:acetyltransferase-like isoleucine patch superfamily enzyme